MILIILSIVVALFFMMGGQIIGIYNTLIESRQDIKEQWSNLLTEYQRRADLIINLVASVKGYMKFENKTLKEVTEARSGNFGSDKNKEMKTMNKMDGMLSRLMVVVEKYPSLKSDVQVTQLNENMRITEDRVNIARTDYNALVNDYNSYILKFPTNIVSNFFNFKSEEYFENEEGTTKAPRINLDIEK